MIDPTTYKLMMSNRIDPSDTTIVSNRFAPSDTSVSAYKRKPPKNEKVIVTPIKNYTEKELINQRPIGNLFPSQTQYVGGYKEIKEKEEKERKRNISNVVKAQSEYLSSPLYQQRASKYYKPDELSSKSKKSLQALREMDVSVSNFAKQQAFPEKKRVNLHTDSDVGVMAHEFGHMVGARPEGKPGTAMILNREEQAEILKRNKHLKSLSNKIGKPIISVRQPEYPELNKDNQHKIAPFENKADIESMRYIFYKQGVTKKYGENITPEQFKKALQNPKIEKEFTIKRLRENFDDKDIIELNNILAARRTGQQNLA